MDNITGAGRNLVPSTKTKIGNGFYVNEDRLPQTTEPVLADVGVEVHEWASLHVIFYSDSTDNADVYITVRPWRWYPDTREGHGLGRELGRWIPDKEVDLAMDPDQCTGDRGSHEAWETRDCSRMYWQIIAVTDVGGKATIPRWIIMQPYGLVKSDAPRILVSSTSGGGGGAGAETLATHDAPVIAEGPQEMWEAKDFDGSALPNDVGEGDAVRPAASLHGVPFTLLTDKDGSDTPVALHDAAISAAAGGSAGIMAVHEAKDRDGAAFPNAVAEGDAVRPAASLSGVGYGMLVSEDGSKTAMIAQDTAIADASGGTIGVMGMLEARNVLPTAVANADAARPIADLYGRPMLANFQLTSQSNRDEEIQPLNDKYVTEQLVYDTSITDVSAEGYDPGYFPSSAGATIDSWKDLGFYIYCVGGVNGETDRTAVITLELSAGFDISGARHWTAASPSGAVVASSVLADCGQTLQALGETVLMTATGATAKSREIDFDNLNCKYWRIKVDWDADPAETPGVLAIYSRKKAL